MRERIVFTGACLVFVFFTRRLGTRLVDSGEISLHFDASKAARSWSVSPYPTGQLMNDPANPLKSRSKAAHARNAHKAICKKLLFPPAIFRQPPLRD